uniref:Uncharacterized protein n=1 Tax=Romanomermis culicivorax TaxID=13658 RepID=A0A915K606_ROMCU
MTTSCIPSIHICLDFVHEILSQPDHSKKIFAMALVSHICEQFTIPKAYSCAKLCVDVVETLMTVLPGEEAVAFFDAVFDSLCRFAKILPPLMAKILKLFVQTAQYLKTRLNSQFLTLAPTNPADELCFHTDLDYKTENAKKRRIIYQVERDLCIEERILKKMNGWFRHGTSTDILSIKL